MAEIYSIPDNAGNTPQFTIPIGGMGGFGGGMFGNGQTNLMDLLGFAIVASMFPNLIGRGGFGGMGGFGGGIGTGNGAAGFLSNQISNDTGRELIIQAITNQGESSRTAIQTLSTMLGQDFNLVNSAVANIQNALNTIGANQGLNALQVINAIQAGDANLASQFQNCCCQNQLAMCQQTNALQQGLNANAVAAQQGFAGVQQSIAAKSAADQLAMCQQTYNLNDTANRNYLALDNKIDAMESSRKDREIAAKDAEIATLKSQNFTAGLMAQSLAPVNAALASLNKEVDDIKCKMPNTVPVQYPNVVAVSTTPYVGNFYGYNSGNGFWG